MIHKNPALEAIKRNLLNPELSNRKMSVEGSIMQVDYYNQTVRVYWRDPDSGTERESTDVPIPQDGDGVFRQSLEVGDRVTLSFKNGNHTSPYITIVHGRSRKLNYQSKYGAGVPKGISFL